MTCTFLEERLDFMNQLCWLKGNLFKFQVRPASGAVEGVVLAGSVVARPGIGR